MKLTKRLPAILLTVSLLTLPLTGCDSNDNPTVGSSTSPNVENSNTDIIVSNTDLSTQGQTFVISTQGVDTAVYTRTSAFVDVVTPSIGTNTFSISPNSTGGAAGALLVESGQSQFDTASNIPVKKLAEGTYSDEYQPLQNTRAILGGTDITWGTLFFSDDFVQKTGYTTLEEIIADKYPVRIVTKAQGSFGMDYATDLLECLGVTWEDIDSWGGSHTHIDPTTMADMLKEGQADISIDCISIGQAAFTELCLTSAMHVPELAEETRAAMNEKGYVSMTMPANSWNGQTEDVETVCGCECLVVSKDVPDDVVYAFTKAICENKDYLVSLVPAMSYFEPSEAWQPDFCGVELHPGAEQYFRDAGYIE